MAAARVVSIYATCRDLADAPSDQTVRNALAATLPVPPELEQRLKVEIGRKLDATEAENTLAEPLTVTEENGLTVYRYAIRCRGDGSEALLRTTVFFDGERRYEFHAAIPPVTEEEYAAIVASFERAAGG